MMQYQGGPRYGGGVGGGGGYQGHSEQDYPEGGHSEQDVLWFVVSRL